MNATRTSGPRVVFPEMQDARIAEAAERLTRQGLAQIVPLLDPCAEQIDALQKLRPTKSGVAQRLLKRDVIRAAAMVGAGQADILVAGAITPTKRVIEAAKLAIGLAPDCTTASSFFLMRMPGGQAFVFADCALNVAPNARELADIARASARSAKALLGHAQVALLSYATGASAVGHDVDKVKEAARISGFTGPIQADAALNAAIATQKGVAAPPANTLVFPSLESGNIAYKLMQELAGAQAIGPVLQGFRHPVCDLSRGASVDDIVAATLLSIRLQNGL